MSLAGAAVVAWTVAGAAALFGPTCGGLAVGSYVGPLEQVSRVAGAPMAVALIFAAVLPFAGAVARYLRRPA